MCLEESSEKKKEEMKQRKFRIKRTCIEKYDPNDVFGAEYIYRVQMKLLPGIWFTLRKYSSDDEGMWEAEACALNMLDALNKEGL